MRSKRLPGLQKQGFAGCSAKHKVLIGTGQSSQSYLALLTGVQCDLDFLEIPRIRRSWRMYLGNCVTSLVSSGSGVRGSLSAASTTLAPSPKMYVKSCPCVKSRSLLLMPNSRRQMPT